MKFKNKYFVINGNDNNIYLYDYRDGFSMNIPYNIMDLNTLIKHLIKISEQKAKERALDMEKYIYKICNIHPTHANFITVSSIKEYLPYLRILNNDFSDTDNMDIAGLKLVYQNLLERTKKAR